MEDTDPKSSASAPATVTYVFLPFLLEVLLQFLVLVFALDMLDSISYMQPAILSALDMFSYGSYMNMLFTFSLSNCMICFITATLVMLYLVFLLIKSLGKLLIFPTVCTCISSMTTFPNSGHRNRTVRKGGDRAIYARPTASTAPVGLAFKIRT